MLLVGTGGSRSLLATGAEPRAGDPLNLHFSVPTPQGEQHFRMQAMISRVVDSGNGMGIRFPMPLQPKAFEVLMDFAVASGMVTNSAADLARGRKPESETAAPQTEGPAEIPETFLRDRRIRDEDAEQVKEQLRRIATRGVNRVSKLFFEKCDRDLLLKARDAGTNAVQMMYFEGLDQLEKQQRLDSHEVRPFGGRADRSDLRLGIGARKTATPRDWQQREVATRGHRRIRRVVGGRGSHLEDGKPL